MQDCLGSAGEGFLWRNRAGKEIATILAALYIVEDMKAGDVITEKNMRSIRLGLGLAPRYYDVVLGKRVKCDIKRGTALAWDCIE